jgi:misacylated tRNA(Ala) deacylase
VRYVRHDGQLGGPVSTTLEFLVDPYRTKTEALVLFRDNCHVVLDRTVFYPATGISPADTGSFVLSDGRVVHVNKAVWDGRHPGVLSHLCEDVPPDLLPGQRIVARIAWPVRYMTMRIHTALHVLSVALPYPMIGGEIGTGRGSATFEIDHIGVLPAELEKIVQDLVDRNMPVEGVWILPPLRERRINIRSFAWPGSGIRVRAIRIDAVDLQPCDGLHVKNTAEIGRVTIERIERVSLNTYRCEISLPATEQGNADL